jgi:hypothetical protein
MYVKNIIFLFKNLQFIIDKENSLKEIFQKNPDIWKPIF